MSSTKKFDLKHICAQFSACFKKSPKLDMDSYLKAYEEFNKFFGLMGTVFGFVSSDVASKIEILQNFRQGLHADKFETIEDMILHEKAEKLFEDAKYISGSRTLLRLHRALIFIAQFLEELLNLKATDKLAGPCQKAYAESLGQYHPWIVQKAANMAMYTLPTREGLLLKIKGPEETEEEYAKLLPDAVNAMKEVYSRTQKFYQEHNLLQLP